MNGVVIENGRRNESGCGILPQLPPNKDRTIKHS